MGESQTRFTVLIVGGGAAGIAVAAAVRRKRPGVSVAVVEPGKTHIYQPGLTLVGAGVMPLKKLMRQEYCAIPPGVTWLRRKVVAFDPAQNQLSLDDGQVIGYRTLVVCPGLQLDWGKIEGLPETLGKNGVCSNYDPELAEYTWECIRKLRSGRAVFTQPPMPIKCAGAPQKIAYLASDYWRRKGILNRIRVDFSLAGEVLFGVKHFTPSLQNMVDFYGIHLNFRHELIAVDGNLKQAIFRVSGADGSSRNETVGFDMLHVVPPQSAPDFIKNSPLADEKGWLDVDHETLHHKKFSHIFGLGDVINTPNAKTAAAVREQVGVVVRNVFAVLDSRPLKARYNGYGACPLTVAYGRVVLAEFLYGGVPAPSFPYDQRRPSRFAWFLKTTFFPFLYWNFLLKGHSKSTFERLLGQAARRIRK